MLWDRRQFAHITISEIEALARVYSIYDVERFVSLVMFCDQSVHEIQVDINEKLDKRKSLDKLKGK